MTYPRLTLCQCGTVLTVQPLAACRFCKGCGRPLHTHYDVLLHSGHDAAQPEAKHVP